MFSKLSSYWEYGNHYSGIEATTLNGAVQYFGIYAQKKKGEFVNLFYSKGASLSEVSQEIGDAKHTFLVINTDKVLIKEIDLERDIQKALSKAFPGLATSDFYYEIHHSKGKSFVAVCRKEEVHTILEEAKNIKLHILGFQLGFGNITPLLNLLSESEIALSRQILQIEQHSISSFLNNPGLNKEYSIEGTKVASTHLLALSSLFQYLTGIETFSNSNEKNKQLKKIHSEKNFFRKGLVIGIATMLLLLLINMFYFTNYRKEYQRLQEETELAQVQKEVLSQKTLAVEKKERIVNNILNSGNSKSSFYINRIVANAPKTLIFSKVDYQPLVKSIRPDKHIEYNVNKMVLKGESTNKEAYSLWIETLEQLDWTTKVTVSDYGSENSREDHFEITLTLKDDTAE